MRKEKAEEEERWLQSLDDDQWHALPNDVKERIIQQSVEKLRLKKLRYRPPSGRVERMCTGGGVPARKLESSCILSGIFCLAVAILGSYSLRRRERRAFLH